MSTADISSGDIAGNAHTHTHTRHSTHARTHTHHDRLQLAELVVVVEEEAQEHLRARRGGKLGMSAGAGTMLAGSTGGIRGRKAT